MKSTGEVMGLGESAAEALGKALIAAGIGLPEPGAAILLSLAERDTAEAMPLVAWLANLRYDLLATEGTAERIRQALGITVESITKKLNEGHPNVVDVIQSGRVSAVVNTVTGDRAPLRDGFLHPPRRHRAAHPLLHQPGHTARRPPGLRSAGAAAPGANRRRVPPGADGLGARRRRAGLNSTLAGLREPSRPERGLRQGI